MLTFRDIASCFAGILARNWLATFVFVVMFSVLAVIFEIAGGALGIVTCQLILAIFGSYFLLERFVVREGFTDGRVPRTNLFVFAGVTVLSSIPISIGLSALIIPGLYLMARWSCAFPAVIVDRTLTVTGALRRSWEATAASHVSIALFVIAAFLCNFAAITLGDIVFPTTDKFLNTASTLRDFTSTFMINALVQWAWAVYSIANIAVMSLLEKVDSAESTNA